MNVLVLCGGVSTEHDISILSARYAALELSKKHNVSVCYVTHKGRWLLLDSVDHLIHGSPDAWLSANGPQWLQLIPGMKNPIVYENQNALQVDCLVSMLHGTNGEDGVMQGLFDVLNLPYVGANTLSSAICMDKDFTKRLLAFSGISVVPWHCVTRAEKELIHFDDVQKALGSECFVKANSLGSSVGVEKATNATEFKQALDNAFKYDDIVLIEQAIQGREIECSVLGNKKVVVSLPGEIINHQGFYSYDAKYVDEGASSVKTPADLSAEELEQVRTLAERAYRCVRCQGMARVDTFLANDGAWYVNEINTLPGFTEISLYPKNWAESGLPGSELFDQLLQLALQTHQDKQALCRVFQTAVNQHRQGQSAVAKEI